MKKLLSFLLIFIAYPAFTQEDTFDNTLLCMNLNPYLKDSFIKFNNSASKAWVMYLDNYIDDISKKLGKSFFLGHHNKSKKERINISPHLQELIFRIYRKDFELLGYQMKEFK